MDIQTADITQTALETLLAGVMPPIRRRIMKAYYLGAGEAFEIAKTNTAQARRPPTSNNGDLPMMLRVQAD